jgi:thymidylate synthase ThyX
MTPSAKVILDSVNESGHRLTTLEVVMHRFVLAEFNTHRVLSRNSASSRAIPYEKTRQRVMDNIAYPVRWVSEQKGMQGGDELNLVGRTQADAAWTEARDSAVQHADILFKLGVHKSLVNRLLEPFMWHTAVVTATEWDNMFWQRCHPDAQLEMKAVADAMQVALYSFKPTPMIHGMWHMPYVDASSYKTQDWADAVEIAKSESADAGASYSPTLEILRQVSVARCARVSYLTQDGVRDMNLDLELYRRLLGSGHWSPFEHVATPVKGEKYNMSHHPSQEDRAIEVFHGCGNYLGWKQFRKTFQGENRQDFLPNLPELAQQRMRMEQGLTPWA